MSTGAECLLAFMFGSAVGLLVQRSRYCNTAALRDAILFKSYRNTKALVFPDSFLCAYNFVYCRYPPTAQDLSVNGKNWR